MIQLAYKKKFQKHFQKLPRKIQYKTIDILEILEKFPYNKILHRHKLKGEYIGKETINVTGDIRILIKPKTEKIINILDIGNHSYFYK
jgi:mRNA-degrading endonuclease YafQ of YafQ-DinJ toxin-antitoxin module